MSGNRRYLLDTNAIIALLAGQSTVLELTHQAEWIGISIISQLEFLAFEGLTKADENLFEQFKQRVDVIELSNRHPQLIEWIIEFRKQYRLKLPDAIIVASTVLTSSVLVTADQALQKVKEITIQSFTFDNL
jgi:tRNA(fMet)-specific endonuclease VapC